MWPRRLQQPHPPIFVPSQGSSETIEWAAEHRYPYVCTYIPMPQLIDYHDEYRRFAEERFGYTAGPEQFGWTSLIYVAETEQEAIDAVAPHPSTSPSDASRCRPDAHAARPHDLGIVPTHARGSRHRRTAGGARPQRRQGPHRHPGPGRRAARQQHGALWCRDLHGHVPGRRHAACQGHAARWSCSPTRCFLTCPETLRARPSAEPGAPPHARWRMWITHTEPAPIMWARPVRAPSTWRAPASPRSCCTVSQI